MTWVVTYVGRATRFLPFADGERSAGDDIWTTEYYQPPSPTLRLLLPRWLLFTYTELRQFPLGLDSRVFNALVDIGRLAYTRTHHHLRTFYWSDDLRLSRWQPHHTSLSLCLDVVPDWFATELPHYFSLDGYQV